MRPARQWLAVIRQAGGSWWDVAVRASFPADQHLCASRRRLIRRKRDIRNVQVCNAFVLYLLILSNVTTKLYPVLT